MIARGAASRFNSLPGGCFGVKAGECFGGIRAAFTNLDMRAQRSHLQQERVMSVEINFELDKDTLTLVQGLIQINLDSRDGLREAASNISDVSVAELFQDIARDRETQAAELSRLVAANGEDPQNAGSIMAAAHRAWIDIRSILGGGLPAMLSEAERGEAYINMKYEDAIQNCTQYVVTEILQRHYAAVKATYEAVRFMCEERME
jgi:uncharacterized protein (TIGR02284 family)